MKTKFQEPIVVNTNGHKNPISPARSFGGDNPFPFEEMLFSFLVTGEETQGKLALFEAIQRRGYKPPRQVHPWADVTFYVAEGEMIFYVDGVTRTAPAGTSVFIGRGKEYSFTVETALANTLIAFTPAVTKEYFKKLNILPNG